MLLPSLAFIALLASAETTALQPVSVAALPESCGHALRAVAWSSSESVLVGGQDGVSRYSTRDRSCTILVGEESGLGNVFNVVVDGPIFYAFALPISQYAGLVADGSQLFARSNSGFFVISDIALHGRTRYLLGRYGMDTSSELPFPVVWRTTLPGKGEEPGKPQPLHFVHTAAAIDALRKSAPPFTGSLAVGPDGTLYIYTAMEPGVFRYRPDGTALPPLGTKLTMLTVARMADLFTYRADELGRYENLINKQPTVDDLVVTPDGPALVVRSVTNKTVTWELWYPGADDLRARVQLGLRRPGPFGHLRCDARQDQLACILDQPRNAASPEIGGASLYVFHLPRIKA